MTDSLSKHSAKDKWKSQHEVINKGLAAMYDANLRITYHDISGLIISLNIDLRHQNI
jgi:hypothetical protein